MHTHFFLHLSVFFSTPLSLVCCSSNASTTLLSNTLPQLCVASPTQIFVVKNILPLPQNLHRHLSHTQKTALNLTWNIKHVKHGLLTGREIPHIRLIRCKHTKQKYTKKCKSYGSQPFVQSWTVAFWSLRKHMRPASISCLGVRCMLWAKLLPSVNSTSLEKVDLFKKKSALKRL